MAEYKILNHIENPEDLRRLSVPELETLASELRDFMVSELSVNPGHLGSSLGAVELAIALHYVYDTPQDKVIWDVGHQAYAHKILTGRRELFHTNRKLGGISGFPRMSESPYDAFGGGHASVSISAALGIAQANKLQGIKRNVIAVIGDGALTGGLAYEGLNNAGISNADMLVILNDNNMAISPNVGALQAYLLGITTSQHYNRLKSKVWDAMSIVPRLRRGIQNMGNAMKQSILKQSNLFESLNFRYFGPVDGVYDADPEKHPEAVKFDTITFSEAYNRGLKIMDLTAFTLCRENGMPVIVFNMDIPGNLRKVVRGETVGTLVSEQ